MAIEGTTMDKFSETIELIKFKDRAQVDICFAGFLFSISTVKSRELSDSEGARPLRS